MKILFDGHLHVHYGFVFLAGAGADTGPGFGQSGQANGLLGAGVPHQLSMMTGLHTGAVRFRVERHDHEPPLPGPERDDVVEASVDLQGAGLRLSAFDDAEELAWDSPGWHRARYSASRFAAGSDMDTAVEDGSAPDDYVLQLWPAPPLADRVVRVSGPAARYWHDAAQGRA